VATGKWFVALGISLLVPLSQAAGEETIQLRTGGRLRGEAREASGRAAGERQVTIELRGGGRVTLERRGIVDIRRIPEAALEYERRAPATPRTVADQWELAEWCREAGLAAERKLHLQMILELETDHLAARRALGYFQHRGQWTTRKQTREEDGYVQRDGHWRLPQQVQVQDERQQREAIDREWVKRLERYREHLLQGKPHERRAARDQLLAIRDPQAIDPLTRLVLAERLRPLKSLYVNILGEIEHPRAVHQLAYLSLVERDQEILHACLDRVAARQNPDVIETYVKALQNADNGIVNRAALALKKLDDPSAIGPLIEALVTRHPLVVSPGAPQGASTMTFARGSDDTGGTGFSSGSSDPTIISVPVPNQEVLSALAALTGESFGFDQWAWRRWQASRRQSMASYAPTLRDAQ
jgi:hypothetical protein